MINYKNSTLKHLEKMVKTLGFAIRYEKGNFQSGYCILESKSMIIINKFYDTQARIETILNIVDDLGPDLSLLTHKDQEKLRTYLKQNAD